MDNYFSLFDLTPSFLLDVADLRKRYYKTQRDFHPDKFTLTEDAVKDAALAQSALSSVAYETLADPEKRRAYLLQWLKVMPAEGQAKLPSDFLMEVMDLNEALIDQTETASNLKKQIEAFEENLLAEVQPYLASFNPSEVDAEGLEKILQFHLKNRYLLRLKGQLPQD